ncbi:YceI family protein [Chitinophaga sp. MM2321]|uniref:YceI family protein n=1 Tax=Chitinophaga sp. MM2321 TaxID=3137178 RepID=UPI0032D56AB6
MKVLHGKFLCTMMLTLGLLGSCKKDNDKPIVSYELDAAASVAEWKGYLMTGYFNEGSIGVASTALRVVNGKVKGGSFVLPLSSIKNFNLPTEDLKTQLIEHLQSDAFFKMVLYPQITFDITSVAPYTSDAKEDLTGANYTITGNLTMVGKSLPISFPAKITIAAKKITVTAAIKVDRTKWGIDYAAAPELPDDQRILHNIDIHLKLSGKAK